MKDIYAGSCPFPKRNAVTMLIMLILAGVLTRQLISTTELATFPNKVAVDLYSLDKKVVENRGVVMCAFNKKTSRLAWTQVINS